MGKKRGFHLYSTHAFYHQWNMMRSNKWRQEAITSHYIITFPESWTHTFNMSSFIVESKVSLLIKSCWPEKSLFTWHSERSFESTQKVFTKTGGESFEEWYFSFFLSFPHDTFLTKSLLIMLEWHYIGWLQIGYENGVFSHTPHTLALAPSPQTISPRKVYVHWVNLPLQTLS